VRADGTAPVTLVRLLRLWAVVAAGCAVASFPASSAFSVREVVVRGTRALDPDTVVRAAGLGPGIPLSAVDPGRVRQHLLRVARVWEAWVEVRWPHRVEVRVQERTPVAVLRLADGAEAVVDGEAVVLERGGAPGLPVVLGPALPWVQLGEPVPAAGVVRLVAELADLPDPDRSQVRWARWLDPGDYTVGTREGLVARVRAGQLRWGLRAAQEVLRTLAARGVRAAVVDLRFGDRAVVQPAP
jgi:cell division protein FtsQ